MKLPYTLTPEMLKVFETLPDLYLILSPELIILTASNAYLEATFTTRDNIVGKHVFKVFPDNPDTPEAKAVSTLEASFLETLTTRKPHQMAIQHYDVPHPDQKSIFIERYWAPLNTPVLDEEGKVVYLIHKVVNVTDQIQSRKQAAHAHLQVQTLNEEIEATHEELRAINEELLESKEALEQLNNELESLVEQRTRELKFAQVEAQSQRERLERFFIQAPALICIHDGPDLVFELVNPVYQQLFFGRELLGKPLLEALPELEGQPLMEIIQQVYQTGQPYQGQEMLVPLASYPGGPLEERYWNFTYQARRNAQGMVDGMFVFSYDVTDQVVSRRKVEASEKQLRLITDALPVLIGYLDKEEKYRFANRAYQEWFQRKPETLLGIPVREVVGEKAYSGVKKYIERALAGERLDFEAKMLYRENFTKHIHTNYVPDIQEGEVVGFYTLVTDITEQAEARQRIIESKKEAQAIAEELAATNEELIFTNGQLTRTNVDLDNFIYTASHDLKAPISNIEGLLMNLVRTLTRENMVSERINRLTELIQDSVERFKRTIVNLTEVVKLQKENSNDNSLVNLAQVFADVCLDLDPIIEESGARLEVDLDQCPSIHFSERNMRSVIYNLLSNSLKYRSPDRAPLVKIYCRQQENYLLLSVEDNGLGMDLSDESKIFAMFKRLHDHVEGSGIGLYIIKKMVENTGGRIEVKSQVNVGSTFTVYFKRGD